MTLTLELPPDLEQKLTSEATALGMPVQDYVLKMLRRRNGDEPTIETGADLVAYWQREGLIGTRPDITDSQAYARELRANAEKRIRE